MAQCNDSEEEGSLQIPDHIGKESDGFVGRHEGDKKSWHLMKAEKTLLEDNVPVMILKIGCMQLNQDAKICANKKAADLNLKRSYVIEGILHQSRATVLHKGADACKSCKSCKDLTGYFASCRTLEGFCNGCCANCMTSGEGHKRCSFVAGQYQPANILLCHY